MDQFFKGHHRSRRNWPELGLSLILADSNDKRAARSRVMGSRRDQVRSHVDGTRPIPAGGVLDHRTLQQSPSLRGRESHCRIDQRALSRIQEERSRSPAPIVRCTARHAASTILVVRRASCPSDRHHAYPDRAPAIGSPAISSNAARYRAIDSSTDPAELAASAN